MVLPRVEDCNIVEQEISKKPYVRQITKIHNTPHEIHSETNIFNRRNEDVNVNTYGKMLTDIAEQTNLVFFNGQTLGDLKGMTTRHKYNGASRVNI